MISRRSVLAGLAFGALASSLHAHTPYRQWVVFRQKHLLIGCHRQEPVTYDLAQQVVAALADELPEAAARPARAPHPQRLASLLGTGQLYLAIVSAQHARQMRSAADQFAPYGQLPLQLISTVNKHVLVAHADFPMRHAWLVRHALLDHAIAIEAESSPAIPMHPGAVAASSGVPLEELN